MAVAIATKNITATSSSTTPPTSSTVIIVLSLSESRGSESRWRALGEATRPKFPDPHRGNVVFSCGDGDSSYEMKYDTDIDSGIIL
jgi:hypothetical protein